MFHVWLFETHTCIVAKGLGALEIHQLLLLSYFTLSSRIITTTVVTIILSAGAIAVTNLSVQSHCCNCGHYPFNNSEPQQSLLCQFRAAPVTTVTNLSIQSHCSHCGHYPINSEPLQSLWSLPYQLRAIAVTILSIPSHCCHCGH